MLSQLTRVLGVPLSKSCSLSIATPLNVVKPSHHVLTIHASLLCHSFMYATLLIKDNHTVLRVVPVLSWSSEYWAFPYQVMQLVDRDTSECRDAFAPCAHHSTHLLCDEFICATLLVDQHSTHLSHRDLHSLCDCCTLAALCEHWRLIDCSFAAAGEY